MYCFFYFNFNGLSPFVGLVETDLVGSSSLLFSPYQLFQLSLILILLYKQVDRNYNVS
jgi:hypothetical protein